jgi:hypothetical protein
MSKIIRACIVGDIHGMFGDFEEHYARVIREEGCPDLLIQVGDCGFWPKETRRTPPTTQWSHPIWWIDGNHEDFDSLEQAHLPLFGLDSEVFPHLSKWEDWLTRWKYQPRGTIKHGVLFIGGARSVDQVHRVKGHDWFPQENISYVQQNEIFEAIDLYGVDRIHTIISHDCPGSFDVTEACTYSGIAMVDGNRKFLQAVLEYTRPKNWFFGHYHKTMQGVDPSTLCEWKCIDMTRSEGLDYVFLDLPEEE